jgi:hypothetical protein
MRRFIGIPAAGLLLLAIAAPVAAGPNVENTSGQGSVLYGEWYGTSSSGHAFVEQDKGQPGYGEIYEENGAWVVCPGGTEEEGPYGFQGTTTWGWAYDVEVSISRRLKTATASGTVDLIVDAIDECAGSYDSDSTTESFSIDLLGAGSVATYRNSGSYKVPSEFNSHGRERGKERGATGSIDLGSAGSRTFDWAVMTQFSWGGHTNG